MQKTSLGQLINVVSNDVDKFDRLICYFHRIWIGVLKIAIATYLLCCWSGAKGISVMVVTLIIFFLQCVIFKMSTASRTNLLKERDIRVTLMTNIVSRIQAIKMYVWEKSFAQMIKAIRRTELQHASRGILCILQGFTLSFYAHKVAVYIFILLLTVTATSLEPQLIFMTINICNILRSTILDVLSAVFALMEVKTALPRIQKFLLSDQEDVKTYKGDTRVLGTYKIHATNVTAKWVLTHEPAVSKVNFELRPGEMAAIVGCVGSGKSSLLHVILNELPIISGSMFTKGSISYAAQSPWVIPATIRENIIFGETFNERKYRKVLDVCALEHDISRFPHGDNTLVGERGILLSGGQKARVSLARAVYKDADIYLLDDNLAAVDTSVAHHIFTRCFLEYLKNKSIIFVTHQLKFLQSVDRVYVLENGKVKKCGKYETIQTTTNNLLKIKATPHQIAETELEKYTIQHEIKEDIGSSDINAYKTYLLTGNHKLFICLQLLLFILTQASMNGSDFFLSFWINVKYESQNFNSKFVFFSDYNCLYIYSGLVFIVVFFHHLSSWTFLKCCMNSSRKLHDILFNRILFSSMKCFNDHASGRIVNRVSRDIAIVDELISIHMYITLRQFFLVLGVCFVVIIMNYYMIFATVVLFVAFYFYYKFSQLVLHRLKKIAATRKSPILTQNTTTVEGLATIRALKAQEHCLLKFENYQNSYNAIDYLYQALYYAYTFWTDLVFTLYIAVVIFYLIVFKENALVGNIGLSITETLFLIGTTQMLMKASNDLDVNMTSVERVAEYSDLILEDNEGTFIPSESWPKTGKITFQSVYMRYSPVKPYILKDINLQINSGEKIGVVGRTGAGKSSLISVLFRLYDYEGIVWIDDVDTKLVPLSVLRSNIAVIPQDPVLFSGTIRSNLDPFEDFTDDQLWSCLEAINLKTTISTLPSGLNSQILENGSNFSVGQRQMLCLVRAVLKKSTILVLDEATAFVDLETDKLIQSTIQRQLPYSTILKIAHRLDTIMDSDKILVIEDGFILEYGTPGELLQKRDGHFYKYANQNKK